MRIYRDWIQSITTGESACVLAVCNNENRAKEIIIDHIKEFPEFDDCTHCITEVNTSKEFVSFC